MTQQKVNLENLLTIADKDLSEDARLMRHYFMQIISVMPNNVYWRSKNKESLGCNKNVLKLLNLEHVSEFNGITYEEMSVIAGWHEGQGLSFKKDDEEVMTTGQAIKNKEEPALYDEQGKPVHYVSTRVPLKDEQGNIQGIVGISTDITEIKKREQELITYAEIMNNLPGAIYWKDKQGKYLKMNKYGVELAGFECEEQMVGKTDIELWSKFAESLMQNDQKVMKAAKPIQFEEAITMPNGKHKYFMAVKIPLKDKDGNIIGIVGNSLDITELKEQKEKLIIYRQIIENLPGYVFWKNRHSIYIGANKNFTKVVGDKTVSGKADKDFFWKQYAVKFVEQDQLVISTGKTLITEDQLAIHDANNSQIIVRTEKSPLHDKNGDIVGVLGISVNITDRKKLEEKQNEFAKTVLQVVHDIRSPLTVIDMLTSEISHLPEEQRVSLRHAVRRINDIANHLIDTYKGRSAINNSIAQKIPVAVFIERIVSEKRFQFAKKGIEFQVSIAPNAYFAFTLFESSELQRVLSNLINNAVEASKENALIEIDLTVNADKKLMLTIKDHGIGMPDEIIKKIGEYGLSQGKAKGSGLGLAHAKEWMERHSGQLQLSSKINEGTVVSLCFAACAAPEWFAQKLNLSSDSVVLIIDDDPSIHFLWTQRLNKLKEKLPNLKMFHFHYVKDLVQWFDENQVASKHLVLLSDNELIGSELNGQQLLEKYAPKVGQAFLVTSHYAFYDLAENLIKIQAKLLPKELVMHLPINILMPQIEATSSSTNIEFVLLDDNKMLTQAYQFLAKAKNRNILVFNQPDELLADLVNIPKETLFYIDSQLDKVRGEDFAKVLFDHGYKELYLATGAVDEDFKLANYPWLKGVQGKPEF